MQANNIIKVSDISPRIYDERQLRALTGLSLNQFCILLDIFETVLLDERQERYKYKTRKPGSGRKSKLGTTGDKLLFILYYFKCYQTFDVLGFTFSMDNSSAFDATKTLFPVLMEALSRLNVLPSTKIETAEQLHLMFGSVENLLVDVTERPTNRPKDAVQQKEHHSGKKKRSCLKNTIISTLGLIVLYIGATFPGKNHDYGMFKKEFNKDLNLFEQFNLMVDLGYKGIQTDYKAKQIYIPHKKPKKSKSNPHPQLTD